jgi:Tfp pilus assembly protein PilF
MALSPARLWSLGAILLATLLVIAPKLSAEPVSGTDTLPAAPTSPAAEKIPEVDEAIKSFLAMDFTAASKKLEEAAAKYPDLPPAAVIMASLYSQANMPNGVRPSLEQAVKDAAADPQAYVVLGDLALRESRVTEADLLFTKANALLAAFKGSPKRKAMLEPQIIAGQATVAEARENWKGAQKLLEAWSKLDAKNAGIMLRMARALFKQADAAGAYEMLKKARATDANAMTAEAVLAQLYEEFGDRANAKKWMDKALKAAPEDLRTHLVAAQWALQTDQIDMAKTEAAAALKIDPKSLDAKIVRGIVDLYLKDYRGAELYFESAHLQSPSNFAATNNLALALAEQEDASKKTRAVEYAQSNRRQYQRSAEAASTLGWVLFKADQLDAAEQELKAAVSPGNFSQDTAYYVAAVSAKRGNNEQAQMVLKAALTNKQPFSKREEAKALLDKIEKELKSKPAEKAAPAPKK